jgi:hypothetical protein
MADRPQRERDLHLPAVEHGGRWYTKYNPGIALDIVERIADGELLSKITAKDAEPLTITKQTFLRWVATVPELSTAYAAAIQISAHAFEEKAIDKAERTAMAPGSPQNVSAASLLISQYRWSAARRNPTRYSDKGNTQIVVPINITTSLDLGNKSQTGEVEVPDIYTIKFEDGKFDEITDQSTDVEDGSSRTGEEEDKASEVLPLDTDAAQSKLQKAKEDWKLALRVDEPVEGTKRQPLLARTGKGGAPKGPRKRILTPRASRHPILDARKKKDGDVS